MTKDRYKHNSEEKLDLKMAGVEPTNANSESDNPVLEEFLKKRRAKRFLLIILVIFALAFLIFVTPLKKGEIQRTYKAYDVINNKEITVYLNIWQEHKLLGKNSISGHITLYEAADETKQKSLMFTGQSAYDIYTRNRELQNAKMPESAGRADRIEAALEANSKIVNDEVQIKSRYSYLYADKGLEHLILLGDAEKAENDIFIIARIDDMITNAEVIEKMQNTIKLYPDDIQFMQDILAANTQVMK